MRDGIFKSLPMPSAWRRLLRLCDRQADRGVHTDDAAVVALRRDMRAELSPGCLSALRDLLNNQQLPFPGFGSLPAVLSDAVQQTAVERRLYDQLQRLWETGRSGANLVVPALQAALTSWAQQHLRQLEQHLGPGDRTKASATLAAAEFSCSTAIPKVTQELLGQVPPARVSSRPAVDLDEDLLRASP